MACPVVSCFTCLLKFDTELDLHTAAAYVLMVDLLLAGVLHRRRALGPALPSHKGAA
jgi:hypothetical protein